MWKPTAAINTLRERAFFNEKVRSFFKARDVLEVETPLLGRCAGTDPALTPFVSLYEGQGVQQPTSYYLQTSPEFAMKRLLAAGSGPIYQLCKAFRNGECGRLHNPEYTILEWYRPSWSYEQLMQEVDDLLQYLLKTPPMEYISYYDLFFKYIGQRLEYLSREDLVACLGDTEVSAVCQDLSFDALCDLIMSIKVMPNLGHAVPVAITEFPASQAVLAQLKTNLDGVKVAERFEVVAQGIELANGFHELICPIEQRQRFEQENHWRIAHQMPEIPIDEALLAALPFMPASSGVAVGLDRCFMLAQNKQHLKEVLSFDFWSA